MGGGGGGGGGPGRVRERVYQLLLLGYPPSFRRRYGSELLETFRDAWAVEARGRPLGAVAFWLRLFRDGVATGVFTRLTRTRSPVGPFDARESVGPRGLVSSVWSDARQALRSFRAAPGFVAVVVLTLGLGIGATTAVYTVVRDTLIRPLPYDDPDQLVRLYMTEVDDPGGREYVTGAHYLAYRERVAAFSHLAAVYTYAETGADLLVGDRPERVRVLSVSSDYFDALGAAPVLGRGFRREEERPGEQLAVLSAGLWDRLFAGERSALGRRVRLSGWSYTVVGVMPRSLEDPLVGRVDVWVPQDMRITDDTNQPYNHYLSVVGRLEPGTSLDRAQAELDAVGERLAEEYPDQDAWRARLVPLKEDLVGGSRPTLYVLLAAGALVLLVACVNVANLFLVRSLGRRRELAVRAALGSGGVRLARQLLTESLVLAAAGGVVGLGVAVVGVDALVALGADTIPRLSGLRMDGRILAFAAVVTGMTGVAFGLVPAVRSARTSVADELRERGGTGGGPALGRLRAALVVVQVALALVLLAGAGLLVASFQKLGEVELGFEPAGALTFEVHLPNARYDSVARTTFHIELARRIEGLPGVTAAGAILRLPATGRWYSWGTRAYTGPMAGEEAEFIGGDQRVVEGRIFAALGMELVRGRAFDDRDDATVPRRYVINQEMARRLFPGIDPIGQTVGPAGWPGEVIGVVEDAVASVEGGVRATIYHHHSQFASNRNWALIQVVRADGDPMALVPSVRRELAEVDPELVLHRPRPLEHVVDAGIAQRRFALSLMLAFAATALVLAALGVYAVLAFAVGQRRHEIGVRMALGATTSRIRRSVVARGLALAGTGALIGLVAALVLGRWLEALVFEVSVADPRVLAGVMAVVLVVAGLAGYLPARRATRVEPRTVLED